MPEERRREPKSSAAEHLPDAELEVLAHLWTSGEATAAEIREYLAEFRPMAHGSVLTLLKRLAEKKLVTREKGTQGKAFVFRATRPAQPTYGRLLRKLTERIFGGSPVALVASLLETYSPSDEELKQIRRLLADSQQRDLDKGEGK